MFNFNDIEPYLFYNKTISNIDSKIGPFVSITQRIHGEIKSYILRN